MEAVDRQLRRELANPSRLWPMSRWATSATPADDASICGSYFDAAHRSLRRDLAKYMRLRSD
jgi:hypothetical protein